MATPFKAEIIKSAGTCTVRKGDTVASSDLDVEFGWEDIKTGKRQDITAAPLLLSSVGDKPTIRVKTTAPRVLFEVTQNGKPSTVFAKDLRTGWQNKFRLGGDTGITVNQMPPGVYTVKITTCDDNGKSLGVSKTASFTLSDPNGTKPDPKPDPKPQDPAEVDPADPKTRLTGKMKVGLCDAIVKTYAMVRDEMLELKPANNRVWAESNNFQNYVREKYVPECLEMEKEIGNSTIFCVAQVGLTVSNAQNAPAWMDAMVADLIKAYDSDPSLKNKKIRVEFGNEPDLTKVDKKTNKPVGYYWISGIDTYVPVLEAVYAKLKGKYKDRVEIISAGFSWDYKTMEQYGDRIAAACDAMAYHGYPPDVNDLSRIEAAVKTANSRNKRLILTEFGLGYGGDLKDLLNADKPDQKKIDTYVARWIADLRKYLLKCERIGVDEISYFIAVSGGTTNSGAALLERIKAKDKDVTVDFKKTPFYTMLKSTLAA